MEQPPKRRRLRLGVIVPSSNTVLEPLTQQIAAALSSSPSSSGLEVTVHFARFRVTKIALSADADAQFALDAMLAAARLLADARVDAVGWSGTSASWLGFASDERLCAAIGEASAAAVPATTSVLAMNAILARRRKKKAVAVGLVTPYTADMNAAIRKNYAALGIEITEARSRCAGLTTNYEFGELSEGRLDAMVDEVVVGGGADTVLIMCTNVRAAQRARFWEDKYGIVVLDSVATVVQGMLEKLGVSTASLREDWGAVFDDLE